MKTPARPEPLGECTAPGTVRLERLLPGPVDRLWAYLTDSEKRAKWFGAGPMEPRAGGTFELTFNHANLSHEKEIPEKYKSHMNVKMVEKVLRYEPMTTLAYTMGFNTPDPTEVTFELTPKGSPPGTEVLLVITHRKLANPEAMANVAGGWHTHTAILIDLLENRPPRGFWTTHATIESQYATRLAHSTP